MKNQYLDEYLEEEVVLKRADNMTNWIITKINDLGYSDVSFMEIDSATEIHDLIIKFKPSTKNVVYSFRYHLSRYVKWCIEKGYTDNKSLYRILQAIDVKSVWDEIKHYVPLKYVNDIQYNKLLKVIDTEVVDNVLYYKTLFQIIYEGIYGKDLYELGELRASDIDTDNNTVCVRHKDGSKCYIKVSKELTNNLIKLSKQTDWISYNNRGFNMHQKLVGKYPDSCFKAVFNSNCSDEERTRKNFYYYRMRKIYKDILGFDKFNAKDLYHSGIINRIIKAIRQAGLEVEEVLSFYHYNDVVKNIIIDELNRIDCTIEPKYFRTRMTQHLDSILNNTELVISK